MVCWFRYVELVTCDRKEAECRRQWAEKERAESSLVRSMLKAQPWICLSSLLSFIHRSKLEQQQQEQLLAHQQSQLQPQPGPQQQQEQQQQREQQQQENQNPTGDEVGTVDDPEEVRQLLKKASFNPQGFAQTRTHQDLTDMVNAEMQKAHKGDAIWTAERALQFARRSLKAVPAPTASHPPSQPQSQTQSRRRLGEHPDPGQGQRQGQEQEQGQGSRPGRRLGEEPVQGPGLGTGDLGSGSRLSILLATDSEKLRPQFVDFLRPFGVVFFSSGKVTHLSKSRGGMEGKLPTLVEFYLLSKAALLVSHQRYVSTFALLAAMYGNGSLVAGGDHKTCRYHVEHLMDSTD